MNANTAQMKLMALQSNTKDTNWIDAVVEFTNRGIPPEVVTRLQELWDVTKIIGGQVYEVGKILVMKIIEFILLNPKMVVGAVIGVAIGSLTNFIPFIGPMLAPLAIAVGLFFGAVAGHRLDKIAKGEMSGFHDTGILADLITMAQEFWRGIVEIFTALKEHFTK
jgi:hypothetical protein